MAYINKSKTDDWKTPQVIYKYFMFRNYFDPCPIEADFDGLAISWKNRNFVNPPYSDLKSWIIKSIEESKQGKEVVLLIPSRTDTKAFKMLYDHGCHFYFIVGRLHFNDDKAPAPFPSVLISLKGDHINRLHYIEKEQLENNCKQ